MKSVRIFSIKFSLLVGAFMIMGYMTTAGAGEMVAKPELPNGKQTSLGLYLTAAEAYQKWQAENGFTNVYQVTDGMEGDAVEDPDSPVKGQRVLNGWKNTGAPWTYEPDLERIKLTKGEELSVDKK